MLQINQGVHPSVDTQLRVLCAICAPISKGTKDLVVTLCFTFKRPKSRE